ncbi:MAG: ACP S-malonyltransferase [Chloroflexi bacterium]|nr:ACP S-malonyltransferase [Chloroflexota bacterium]
MTTAYVFPGQGSQFVGMGAPYMSLRPIFRGTFDRAVEALGFDLKMLCLTGPEAELADTLNTQPAIFTHSLASFYMAEMSGELAAPAFVAGHSLGEISALCAAGALSFEDGVRLTRERGRLMKEAGARVPGAMAAIINMDRDALQVVCDEISAQQSPGVVIANDNSPGQIVISGGKAAVAAACDTAKARGAKRVLPLNVSIASHSPLMAAIRDEFTAAVAATPIQPARVPVVANTSVTPITHPDDLRVELAAQLTSPVRWVESVRWMHAQGVDTFVELGPKDVLSSLIKRILPEGVTTMQVG